MIARPGGSAAAQSGRVAEPAPHAVQTAVPGPGTSGAMLPARRNSGLPDTRRPNLLAPETAMRAAAAMLLMIVILSVWPDIALFLPRAAAD